MSHNFLPSVALLAVLPTISATAAELPVPQVVLGIHGGTGEPKKDMTPAMEKVLRADLQRALEAGYEQLRQPAGTGLDAVEAAIRVLEDSPNFNAGKGAVFTHEGRNELDASIMEGKTLRAGAVASVTIVKNPIAAARAGSGLGLAARPDDAGPGWRSRASIGITSAGVSATAT